MQIPDCSVALCGIAVLKYMILYCRSSAFLGGRLRFEMDC